MTGQTEASLPHSDAARELEPDPLEHFRRALGFVPRVITAQSLTPHLVEADRCFGAVLDSSGRLSPVQRELLRLAVAVAHENRYETALSAHVLVRSGFPCDRLNRFIFDYREADLAPVDVALLDFSLTLARHPTRIAFEDVDELRSHGVDGQRIVEIGYLTALSNYRCVKAAGTRRRAGHRAPLDSAIANAQDELQVASKPRGDGRGRPASFCSRARTKP